jgi:undecaprenyl-diphosphatase
LNKRNHLNLADVEAIEINKKLWIYCGLFFLISWIIAFLLWFQNEIDKLILFSLNNINFSEGVVSLNQFFSRYGMSFVVFIYIIYLTTSLKFDCKKNKGKVFLLILFSFGIAGISGDVLKEIFNRSRPFQVYPNELKYLSNPVTPSFPSGHATKITALVLPFLFFSAYKNRYQYFIKFILFLTALLVCFARILLGAHYLSDVLAGIGWAFITLPIVVLMTNKILKKMTYEKFERAIKIWIFVYIALLFILAKI